ncbi:ABC transporter transmembrane domain-containing protein [Oscillibacter sp.]|uniref:ABC transporter transmembrane domain-containing protein n=1 Tax=Oscillibacter sp. TaxID=1945593 RepID=UPI0028A11CD0|nr:ABC transporter transmembrane domain-containing protein [Oscillibacter sp.]
MKQVLKKLTFGHPKHLARPAVWLFFEGFSNLFPAIIIYVIINMIAGAFGVPNSLNFRMLWITSGILGVLTLAQFVIGYFAYSNSFLPSAEHTAENRISFVKKLRRLPLGFFSNKEKGELINNFAGDFLSIQQAMTGKLSGLFSVVLSCVLTSIFMFIFNSLMAAAFYISLPVAAIIIAVSMKTLN